jgi:plastocyanin
MSRLRPRPRAAVALLAALTALLIVVPTASAGEFLREAKDGTKYYRYKFPLKIKPGQNDIAFELSGKLKNQRPSVDGYITYFKPDLVRKNGEVPPVDVIHLHHAVWIVDSNPTFAAGEEKTTQQLPRGYGYHYKPSDSWIMNYMIHNLTPKPTKVSITYDIDFVPDSTPTAAKLTEAHPLWMDVSGLRAYPVFDALKGQGKKGKFTFPDQANAAQQQDIGGAHEYTANRDITLLSTAGHLHPGGLYTDLKMTRNGRTRELFRSVAKYFEPAGAVSWDVSMTHTKPDWRVALKAGDRLNVSATYDTSRASWYESMGIMVLFYADGKKKGAKNPFATKFDWKGLLTHGHLPENNGHGGKPRPGRPDARNLPGGVFSSDLEIEGYVYGLGDLASSGKKGLPPRVPAGQSLTFTNLDATPEISAQASAYHTITSCKAPCTASTGIAYPLANAKVQFDSGELGYGPPGFTPAANRNTWSTPKNLKPGTYTYFCRIHPFMRGAFRVVKGNSSTG